MSNTAVKNAKIVGVPRVINPMANLLEVTVQYETMNGSRQQKSADVLVRLIRTYNPALQMYFPDIDLEARKQINEGGFYNPVVSAVPMSKVNGESAELADVVIAYFKNKFVEQYK